jgi:hypothetical protein
MDKELALKEVCDFKDLPWDAFYVNILNTPRTFAMVGGATRAKRIQKKLEGHSLGEYSHICDEDFPQNVARQLMFNSDYNFPNRKLVNAATFQSRLLKKGYFVKYPDTEESKVEIAKLTLPGISYPSLN